MVTQTVASKHYCLLQVLMAALLLVSCAALVKRYPDPLDSSKYYLRIDDQFYYLTCPNKLKFNQYIEQCTVTADANLPNITPLLSPNCSQNMPGYYCEKPDSFIYCTHDGLKIIDSAVCLGGKSCGGPPNTTPCV